jgi:DNA (cytosine-5)-methyltransferase 1
LAGLPDPDEADIVRPSSRRAVELAALSPGTGLRTGGRIENNRPSGHWGYRQDCFIADPSLPARTIRAASSPDWVRLPDGSHRRLTWRECAALQGLPGDWRIAGTVASRFRQIGNAVQADVVEALGRALMAAHLAGRTKKPEPAPFPTEFERRIKYTAAEHRTNGEHRVRVRASVT